MPAFVRANIAIIIVCVAYAGALVYFATRPPTSAETSFYSELSSPFKDYDGGTVRLSSFMPHPLIVYVWASWCPYCADEFRTLSSLDAVQSGAVVVAAINRGEPRGDAKAFTDALSLPKSVVLLLDPEDAFFKSVGGYAMPELLFVDSKSAIVSRSRGPMTAEEIGAALQTLR